MGDVWPVLKGCLTHVPGLYGTRAAAGGGTISARYCYSVWLRHLVTLHEAGLRHLPSSLAELGPGLSLGVGLVALLTGTSRYLALDVSRDASPERHASMLEELAAMLEAGAPIPDDTEFPEVLPRLGDYRFPHWVRREPATEDRVRLARELLTAIPDGHARAGSLSLTYRVPWLTAKEADEPVEVVLAQAVFEHVRDPAAVYAALAERIVPGGFLSLTIDFRSHGLTRAWNGHWGYTADTWRMVEGARPWGLNRWTLTQHLGALRASGFEVLVLKRERGVSGLGREQLAPEFRAIDAEDLETASAYLAARREES